MNSVEWFVLQSAVPAKITEAAAHFESVGWDGLMLTDNQSVSGDSVVALTLAVQATSTLRIGTAVTNTVTRHPAVLAAAFLNLQALSNGRITLGIGRGDSALAYIGLAPARVADFERSVAAIRAFLDGSGIPLSQAAAFAEAPPVESLGYASLPDRARIEWRPSDAYVEMDVTGSGPRTIAVGARHADRITFSVGASPERLGWGIDVARRAAKEAGRNPDELSFGAHIQMVCHDDAEWAMNVGRGVVATHARFGALHGRSITPVAERHRDAVEQLAHRYEMTSHGYLGKQADLISDDFAKEFSIFGPPEVCIDRAEQILATGIDRLVVIPLRAGDEQEQRASTDRIAAEVIPALR